MVRFVETAVDADTAHGLLAEYFTSRTETFPGGASRYRTVFPSAPDFTPTRGVFLVVHDAEGAVGCGGIRHLDTGSGGTVRYEIKHLYLQPKTRGRGLGRMLLAELERLATQFGATELVLDTNASLEAAGGLYRSSGFVEIPPYNENPNATTWFLKPLGA